MADKEILARLHRHCLFETLAGEQAQKRGLAPDIKKFGERLEEDYKVADLKTRALAGRLGVKLNKQESAAAQARWRNIKARGAAFDRRLVRSVVRGHEEIIPFLERQITLLPKDGPLFDLINQLLPTIYQHYQAAATLGGAPK